MFITQKNHYIKKKGILTAPVNQTGVLTGNANLNPTLFILKAVL